MTIKSKYSPNELAEFEEIINQKLEIAKGELANLKRSLKENTAHAGDGFSPAKTFEDSVETIEKEDLNQLAGRQLKFIHSLENALIRIKNGTYGVCIDTGKLIPKERLKIVPHTRHSIESKENRT